ncbi:MAG TPA: hypothetical protein VKB76_12600, partial [Ktedonobacterales bacterium]|nr:hypothetical protein [Ktedonobacterales bacterium]
MLDPAWIQHAQHIHRMHSNAAKERVRTFGGEAIASLAHIALDLTKVSVGVECVFLRNRNENP